MKDWFSKTKLSKEQKKLYETLLFIAKLIIFSIPLYIILNLQGLLLPLQMLVTNNVYLILKSIGFNAMKNGILLTGEGIAFFISEDCTGWKSMLFLAALLFAVPKVPKMKRFIGLLIGIPIIYIGNLYRILLVVFVWKVYGQGASNLLHDYLWQIGLVSLVLVIWIIWLLWIGRIGRNKEITFLNRLRKLIKPR